MADLLERLRKDEAPEVGDVFQMFEGAYGTAIVTKVVHAGVFHIERVMMSCTGATGTPATSYERMQLSYEDIRKFKFYRRVIAGETGSITIPINDNRWYDKERYESKES